MNEWKKWRNGCRRLIRDYVHKIESMIIFIFNLVVMKWEAGVFSTLPQQILNIVPNYHQVFTIETLEQGMN